MPLRWLLVPLLLTGCWDGDKPSDVVPPIEVATPEPPPPPPPEPTPEPEPEPVHELSVTIDNTFGDRFKPVSVRVEYTIDGVGALYEKKVPYGDVEESHDGFLIYGDGQRHENLVFTVNGEEFLYQLREEASLLKGGLEYRLHWLPI